MLAAEQSGAFQYKGGISSASDVETKLPETPLDNYTQRLQDISISAKDNALKASAATISTEKTTTKSASSSRPLTIDDDDLDIDLEIDENIDTSVSYLIPYIYFFIPLVFNVEESLLHIFCKKDIIMQLK